MRTFALVAAIGASMIIPATTLAQGHGSAHGGGRPSGAMARPAGGSGRMAPQGSRAPAVRGGFNFDNERNAIARPASRPEAMRNGSTFSRGRTAGNAGSRFGVANVRGNGRVLGNPDYHGAAWGWNRGEEWRPSYAYWGGGFFGDLAIGASSAAVLGVVLNSQTNQNDTSYQIQNGSPGATLLSNYSLTQTECGPANLVDIYGPDASVICAEPNNVVAAGQYDLDTSNLTIVSE